MTKLAAGGERTIHEEFYKQFYYHSDHLGSANLITDYRGDEYQRIEYTPYGEIWVEEQKVKNEALVYLPYKFTGKERDEETGLYYFGARCLDAKYSRWLSCDPALGEYIPQAPVSDEAKKHNQNLPGMGGLFNTVNMNLYHYAGNNPIKYTDPDGNNIVNSTDKYIIARLEKPMNEGKSNEIDTLIIPPHSVAYGAFDGARDEEGNYYKVTGYALAPAIDFEIDSNLKIEGFSKTLNDFGDSRKIKEDKDKPDEKKRILSGKKIKGISPDYDRLKESWESRFIKDVGDNDNIGNSESWASKYNDKSQKDLRKKYKIQTFDEIKQFDQMMHDAHIY